MSTTQSIPAGLALDARSLDGLRRDAAHDPQAAVRKAAGQFEALFMQQLLKSMRAAMPKSGMLDGPGSEMYTSLLDNQLSQAMSGAPGGLADLIARQITRHMQAVQAGDHPAATGPSAGAGVAAADTSAAAPTDGAIERADGARDADALRDSFARRLDSRQAEFVERMWPHALAAQGVRSVSFVRHASSSSYQAALRRDRVASRTSRSADSMSRDFLLPSAMNFFLYASRIFAPTSAPTATMSASRVGKWRNSAPCETPARSQMRCTLVSA